MGIFFSRAKKKEAPPPAPVGPRELSVTKVLASKEATAAFLTFAQGEFSAENLEFWLEVNAFQKRWDTNDQTAREADCKQIIEEFLKEGADRQVCIGDHRVKLIPGEYSKEMFEMPQQIALETLTLDIFPRFADSAKGAELAKQVELTEPLQPGAAKANAL